MKLVTAKEMKAIDRFTIEEVGIPGVVLMENAGRGAFKHIKEYFLRHLQEAVIGVLCGKGNNGGDGFVVARYLHEEGYLVHTFLFGKKEQVKGEAAVNLRIAEKLGVPIVEILDENRWREAREYLIACDMIIDAMLGTGLNSEIRGLIKEAVSFLNETFPGLIVSIDIPTGLSSDTGQPLGDAVRADLTVTFGLPKVGQIIYPGAHYVGNLEIVDIGIPPQVIATFDLRHHLVTTDDIRDILPPRPVDMHKGKAGHVLVLAGSPGKTGAATLACLGALRVGAGLVTLGIAKSLNPILEVKLTEAMTLPLPETEKQTLTKEAWDEVKASGVRYKVICLGPGLSTHPAVKELVKRVILEAETPLVIDADGLNVLAGDLDVLKEKKNDIILTPHPGEMARLVGLSVPEVLKEKLTVAKRLATEYGVIVVLKMARTIVATPEGEIFINSTGNPAMASGGVGDVLTGVIGGILAQGRPAKEAAVLGVFLHGLAGDLWVEKRGRTGLLAQELADYLPKAREVVEKGEEE